ncbi:2'-5' RNA ligase [Isoptericola sp. CG 20/1183]|uniref:RNA 2',3'-cyclic phosphodiesterase n=1 Tax=Isoptericola halotolerans TaxID=300560 RepID=A0ABX5ECH2_9MICO|nr:MULTISPECIES: RNA 2',3'-cyclic phosphodiesterase [Isoptericola]MCK0116570.1 RNA 2',3'-cyclic phosphodiesterase [Isoptericola sp. S6320L]PRZ05537.1 2'-5' RNA ligase [Isoptericola halotolerans]PRZ06105.1 2'-5' RNA ligase [Isoptericola sp. CG 20/1183]
MRLFTAVYPSAQAAAHLDLALGGVGGPAVAQPGSGLRWVPREHRHVTLAFHGEVPDGAVPGYVEALTAALGQVDPFDVFLAGSGTFGGRTLWLGVGGDVDGLRALAAGAAETADVSGVGGQDRAGGRPHLTVARASAARVGAARSRRRGGAPSRGAGAAPQDAPFAHWARALAVYRGPAWPVREVRVVQSVLGAGRSGGPAHSEVAVVPLGGPID